MEVVVVVDKLLTLQLAEGESALSLVEGFLLVELVSVGGSHDVSV